MVFSCSWTLRLAPKLRPAPPNPPTPALRSTLATRPWELIRKPLSVSVRWPSGPIASRPFTISVSSVGLRPNSIFAMISIVLSSFSWPYISSFTPGCRVTVSVAITPGEEYTKVRLPGLAGSSAVSRKVSTGIATRLLTVVS